MNEPDQEEATATDYFITEFLQLWAKAGEGELLGRLDLLLDVQQVPLYHDTWLLKSRNPGP